MRRQQRVTLCARDLCSRFSPTPWLNDYLPVDATGNSVLQATDVCSLFLVDLVASCGVPGGICNDLLDPGLASLVASGLSSSASPSKVSSSLLRLRGQLSALVCPSDSAHRILDLTKSAESRVQRSAGYGLQTVTDDDEIRVTAAGSVSPYIAYAAKVLNELNKPTIVIKGTGNSLSKGITAAEILIGRFKGLRQATNLDSIEIVDEYEPFEEGMDKISETRNVSSSRLRRCGPGRRQLPGWCRRSSPRASSARPASAASSRSCMPPSLVSFWHGSAARPSAAGASRWLSSRLFGSSR